MSSIYKGKGISNGVVIGSLLIYEQKSQYFIKRKISDSKAEMERFMSAANVVKNELKKLYEMTASEYGQNNAQIFAAHRMLLDDPMLIGSVEETITNQQVNAEYAVNCASEKLTDLLDQTEDSFIKARKADVEEICRRLIEELYDTSIEAALIKEPHIILAEDLSPGELMKLPLGMVTGIILKKGSENSHMAILAKARGIPAVIQMGNISEDALKAKTIILDADHGIIYIEPEEKMIKKYQKKLEKRKLCSKNTVEQQGEESLTKCKNRVQIYANASSIEEAAYAKKMGAAGIGLFRSEYLFLGRKISPSEEEQFTVYRSVAELMEGRRVVLRTLDLGSDKQVEYLQKKEEANPALGYRGIRICLDRTDLFRIQLRAMLRASAFGKIDIMLPMIISIFEIRRTKQMLQEIKEELQEKKIPYGNVRLGIMIETPAAVMISDLLALEVDFFSIGTNDLMQYTLAVDRQNYNLTVNYAAHHPAMLRMIRLVVENAHKEGIHAGICGELASDQTLTQSFLRMGIDELSVSPDQIPSLRKLLKDKD